MAEQNLQEALLEETIINREIAEDTQGEISDLSSYFRSYFKDLRNDRLRQMEKDREGQRVGGGLKNLNDSLEKATDIQKSVGGILGLLLGIPTFIMAFVSGAFQGIKDTFKFLSIAFKSERLARLPIVRNLLESFRGKDGLFAAFKNVFITPAIEIVDDIKDTFRNAARTFRMGFEGITSGLQGVSGRFEKLTGFQKFTRAIGRFFRFIVDIPKKLMPAVEVAGDAGKSLGAGLAPIANGIKEVARLFGFIINPFLSMAKIGGGVTKEVGKLGSSVQMIGRIAANIVNTLRGFFGGFGRFLFGPITLIIFTLIDAVRGARDSLKKFGDKVKGNILGLFGIGLLGAVQGVVGGILSFIDMIKNFVLAIPLMIIDFFGGDEITKAIREFSFADWWKSITDKIIKGLLDLGGFIGTKIGELFGKSPAMRNRTPQVRQPADLNRDGTVTPEEAQRYKKMLDSPDLTPPAANTGGGMTAVDASQVDNSTTNSATVSVANPAPAYNPYDRKTSFSFNG
jgi:hypothetical protein